MRSKIAIAGHPIHPMLVTVPIGLLTWALFANVVYAINDNLTWYDIAYWTTLAGVITALVAALPGVGDYVTMAKKSEARSMALTHGALNVAVVLLYGASFLLMVDRNAVDGTVRTVVIVLQGLGAGLLALSGWLGGEMVYRQHLAVVPKDEALVDADATRRSRRPSFGREHR